MSNCIGACLSPNEIIHKSCTLLAVNNRLGFDGIILVGGDRVGIRTRGIDQISIVVTVEGIQKIQCCGLK